MSSAALRCETRTTVPYRPGLARAAELEFLLAACSLGDTPARQRRLRELLEQDISWTGVLALAQSHALIPILYRNLSERADLAPTEMLRDLHDSAQRHTRQALRLTHSLREILVRMDSLGVEAIPVKGPALAQTLFQNVALRQFSDLDILVRPEDVCRAKAALEDLGYTCSLALTKAQQAAYINSGYEYSFDGTTGKGLIELQWRVLPRFYAVDFDFPRLFTESTFVEFAGTRVRTLRAEDLLLVLCAHAAKHVWERLAWTRDIAELMQSPAIDWERARQQAERLGIVRILGISLVLARDLFAATVHPELEAVLSSDGKISLLAGRIREDILWSREHETESVAYFRLMLRLRERGFDRMRFVGRLTFTPGVSEWSTIALPGVLFPLYRLVRLWRLLRRFARLARNA
jgi:putative nucleotidyltransferase-like protein